MRRLGGRRWLQTFAVVALFIPRIPGAAPWHLEPAPQASDPLHARVDNDDNESLVVHRDSNNGIILEFTTTARHGLGRSSCPTFQIDRRTPQHYFALGERCEVAGPSARYTLATVVTDKVVSLILYRLINGARVAFRYVSQDGTYHQSVFSLSQSKQALMGALGAALTIDPGSTE